MTRYIDADKLKEDILEENSWYLYNEFGSTTQFHELIDKQPTADVVEVVYCKDCKHRNEPSCQIVASMYGISDYDYCSYGERRE